MKRGGKIARRTRLRAKGRSRFPKRRDRAYLAWIATLACAVGGCRNHPCDPAHVRSRGAGGADVGNTVPLCHPHHEEQHRIGIVSFSDRYRLNLTYRAERLARIFHPKEDAR